MMNTFRFLLVAGQSIFLMKSNSMRNRNASRFHHDISVGMYSGYCGKGPSGCLASNGRYAGPSRLAGGDQRNRDFSVEPHRRQVRDQIGLWAPQHEHAIERPNAFPDINHSHPTPRAPEYIIVKRLIDRDGHGSPGLEGLTRHGLQR